MGHLSGIEASVKESKGPFQDFRVTQGTGVPLVPDPYLQDGEARMVVARSSDPFTRNQVLG